MSKQIVEQVKQQHPELFAVNTGAHCDAICRLVVAQLRANGRSAFRIAKTQGEGQYIPPGFGRVQVTGLDGVGYTATGVSHDAIYCDGLQFDLLNGANRFDQPIYKRNGEPNWSFDPNDGPAILASPAWDEIPREFWRPQNPPLPAALEGGRPAAGGDTPTLPPASSRPALTVPDYGAIGDDAFFVDKIGRFVDAEMQASAEEHMNAGSASWIARAVHGVMAAFVKNGDNRDADAIALKVRNELRGVLGKPPVTTLDAKA